MTWQKSKKNVSLNLKGQIDRGDAYGFMEGTAT